MFFSCERDPLSPPEGEATHGMHPLDPRSFQNFLLIVSSQPGKPTRLGRSPARAPDFSKIKIYFFRDPRTIIPATNTIPAPTIADGKSPPESGCTTVNSAEPVPVVVDFCQPTVM